MSKLSVNERNNLDINKFGVPQLRKFPLNDKEHTLKALQMFHHCPLKYKKILAKNIYYACNEYDIKLDKNSHIYEYLPKRLQENFNVDFIIEGLEDEFFEFINEAYMNEMEAQEKTNEAISMWRQRLKAVKNSQEKAQLGIEARAERAACLNMMKNGDMYGIIQRAHASTSKMRTFFTRQKAKFNSKSETSNSAVKAVGNKVAEKGVDIAGLPLAAAKGVGKGLAPGVKAGLTIAAAGVGGKVGGRVGKGLANSVTSARGTGKLKTAGSKALGTAGGVAAGAALAGTIAATALTMNQRKSLQDSNIRKHAEKYVHFLNTFIDEVTAINVSATSGAIQNDKAIAQQKIKQNKQQAG